MLLVTTDRLPDSEPVAILKKIGLYPLTYVAFQPEGVVGTADPEYPSVIKSAPGTTIVGYGIAIVPPVELATIVPEVIDTCLLLTDNNFTFNITQPNQ